MIIPNNKKYILYIKIPKTGGTSFVQILKKHFNVKYFKIENKKRILEKIKENDLIIINIENLNKFKCMYENIFINSYKIGIFRNPYDRFLSAYNYHKCIKKKNINIDELFTKNYLQYDSTKIDYKIDIKNNKKKIWDYYSLYTHIFIPQTYNLIVNNKLIIDYKINFDNLNNNIIKFFKIFNINIIEKDILYLNNTKYNTNKIYINKNDINLINNRFKNDFKFLNYEIKNEYTKSIKYT